MNPIILSNKNLLQSIRAKSRVGAEALYDQYAKVLGLAIFHIVHDRDLTNTLLEQTIHEIWDEAALYNEQQVSLLPWMLRIAKKIALQQEVLDLDIHLDNPLNTLEGGIENLVKPATKSAGFNFLNAPDEPMSSGDIG